MPPPNVRATSLGGGSGPRSSDRFGRSISGKTKPSPPERQAPLPDARGRSPRRSAANGSALSAWPAARRMKIARQVCRSRTASKAFCFSVLAVAASQDIRAELQRRGLFEPDGDGVHPLRGRRGRLRQADDTERIAFALRIWKAARPLRRARSAGNISPSTAAWISVRSMSHTA